MGRPITSLAGGHFLHREHPDQFNADEIRRERLTEAPRLTSLNHLV
jgi:hypothetical protein